MRELLSFLETFGADFFGGVGFGMLLQLVLDRFVYSKIFKDFY